MRSVPRDPDRKPEVCAHPDCTCELGDDRVEYKGKSYCSDGCAKGYGCDHYTCRCGVSPNG